jgi:hypothetical protein
MAVIGRSLLGTATVLLVASALGAQDDLTPQNPGVRSQIEIFGGWAREPGIAGAVRAQNDERISLDEIQQLDARWVAGEAEELVTEVTGNACAQRLKALIASDAAYREALVMDNQGALVCVTGRSSDYWQGDEAKWTRSFNGGAGQPFVDRPRYDTSAKAIVVQISVPIEDAGRAIGALTVGVDRAKFGE